MVTNRFTQRSGVRTWQSRLHGRHESQARTAAPVIPEQYECGPVRFAGDPNASYERRLVFDHIVEPKTATLRERFEAVARSLR